MLGSNLRLLFEPVSIAVMPSTLTFLVLSLAR
jgi:hypothetical protein